MSISLKLVKDYEHCEYFKELIRRVWRAPEDDLVPTPIAMTVLKNGGCLLAAYAEDGPAEIGGMVGAAFWWLGSSTHPVAPVDECTGESRFKAAPAARDSIKVCSHMAGVLPGWQGRGIGRRLKFMQRELVLRQGLTDRITWTYDPLYLANGIFNIRRLGGVCNTYVRNVYGEMTDALNRGTPSDRCEIDWHLNDVRVVAAARSQPIPQQWEATGLHRVPTVAAGQFRQPIAGNLPLDGTPLALPIPTDIAAMRRADAALSMEWRMFMRTMLESAFGVGYTTVDCTELENHGWHYILIRR